MATFRSAMLAILLIAAAPAAADPIAASDEREAAARVAREEIERILAADNVDSNVMTTRQIAETIRAIPRGQAPDDFWAAYQAHVRAWEATVPAAVKAAMLDGKDRAAAQVAIDDHLETLAAIEATFAEVLRIAERYGVTPAEPAAASKIEGD